jgi:hypothetical protein
MQRADGTSIAVADFFRDQWGMDFEPLCQIQNTPGSGKHIFDVAC